MKYYLFLICILYLLFFDPPFLFFRGRLDVIYLMSFFSIILLFVKPDIFKRARHFLRKEFLLFLLLLLYICVRASISGDYHFILMHFLSVILIFVFLPYILDIVRKKTNNPESTIVRSILIVSSIASVISMYCLLSPNFNLFIKETIIQYTSEDYLFDEESRGFGLASLLTSNYGYIQGTIAAIGCFYWKDNKWFVCFLPFIILSALINARTGALIAVGGILLFSLSKSNLIKTTFAFIAVYLAVLNLEPMMRFLNINEDTISWIMFFTDEANSIVLGQGIEESRTAQDLFEKMWVLPDNSIQWIIGRGFLLFRNTQGLPSSDVGWIVQLNYGGLVYLGLICLIILYCTRRLINFGEVKMAFFFLFAFLIVNTKSSFYPMKTHFFLMMFIYMICSNKLLPLNNDRQNMLVKK